MATYEVAAHMAYDKFSYYKYLIVYLVFSHLGFWSGNIFLTAHFPDRCLLVPFSICLEDVWSLSRKKLLLWSTVCYFCL